MVLRIMLNLQLEVCRIRKSKPVTVHVPEIAVQSPPSKWCKGLPVEHDPSGQSKDKQFEIVLSCFRRLCHSTVVKEDSNSGAAAANEIQK